MSQSVESVDDHRTSEQQAEAPRVTTGATGSRGPTEAHAPAARLAGVARFRGSAPAVMMLALLLISGSLVFSNPPGASPDEFAHYLKAVAAGRGDLVLAPAPPADPGAETRIQWMKEQSGVVEIPARLSPMPFECWAHPDFLGRCSAAVPSGETIELETYVGSYPPFAYLLPGLLMRAAGDSVPALIAGRIGVLAICLALLGAAALALYERDRPRYLLGLLCAVSPAVLITAASVSNSGVEVASAICFFACLLRLSRSGSPGWIWVAGGISGAALALARDLGPAWIVFDLVLTGIFAGGERLRTLRATGGWRLWLAGGLVAGGVAVSAAWQALNGVRPDLSLLSLPEISFELANGFLRQTVGVFGPLNVFMPNYAYRLWALLVLLLIGVALFAGRPRQRLALVLAMAGFVVLSVALEAVQNIGGFGVQVRHVMPVFLTIPLLAGEIAARSPRLRWSYSPLILPAFAAAAAAVHLTAWHTIGRRFAVGEQGPPVFFSSYEWAPPGGWIPWAALMCAGCALMFFAFLGNRRKELSYQAQ